jgi:energy-coupling factor transporter ATP-binding protein EcfA2
MQLTSIVVKHFRTLHDLTLRFEKQYCTISGRNNAGKSCVIRLLSCLFHPSPSGPWLETTTISYKEDKTQWVKQPLPIEVAYTLSLTKDEDPALISFVEKIASRTIDSASPTLTIEYCVTEGDDRSVSVIIDGTEVDEKREKKSINELRIRTSSSYTTQRRMPTNPFILVVAGVGSSTTLLCRRLKRRPSMKLASTSRRASGNSPSSIQKACARYSADSLKSTTSMFQLRKACPQAECHSALVFATVMLKYHWMIGGAAHRIARVF